MKQDRNQILRDVREFLKWAKAELGIQGPIRVHLRGQRLTGGSHTSFGGFDLQDHSITISYSGRHILDLLRTLAHELVHARQHQTRPMNSEDGLTGSDAENEANALAGVLMRKWADKISG